MVFEGLNFQALAGVALRVRVRGSGVAGRLYSPPSIEGGSAVGQPNRGDDR
jgi:hypothetical protein